MRKLLTIVFGILLLLTVSCSTRVASLDRPLKDNSLELYQKYNIQTQDGKWHKIKVLKIDQENLYGKTTKGEDITLEKSNIREVKKFDLLSSLGIGAAAALALILIPI